jgi:hypothetical protein
MAKYDNNNKAKKNTVSTKGPVFRYRYGDTPSALTISYFDTMLSMTINPPLPEGKRTTEQFYDYDKDTKVYIGTSRAKALAKKCKKVITQYEETGTFVSQSIPHKDGLIQIIHGSEFTSDKNSTNIVIVFYEGLDDDKRGGTMVAHEFPSEMSILGYKNETGKYSGKEYVCAEFEQFADALDNFSQDMGMTMMHATKEESKYVTTTQMKMLGAACAKLGIDIDVFSKKEKSGSSYDVRNSWEDRKDNTENSRTIESNTQEDLEKQLKSLGFE